MVTFFYPKEWSLYLLSWNFSQLSLFNYASSHTCTSWFLYFLSLHYFQSCHIFSWYTTNGIGQKWMNFQKSSAWGYLGLHRSRKKPRFTSAKELYPYLQGTATSMWTATGWWTFLNHEEFLANQGLILVHYGFLIIQVSVP